MATHLFSPQATGTELTVFAAVSLRDVLAQLGAYYEKQTGDKAVFSFGASSLLARQIEAGAPADVFFSADEDKMNQLEAAGLILKETRKSLLSNALVIVVSAKTNIALKSAADLMRPEIKRIALAEPRTVPAGIYARRYLENSGVWKSVQPKVIPTENVRAALVAVEGGNADAAIVYRTDVRGSKDARIAYEVPPDQTPAISYSVAVVKGTKAQDAARKLVAYFDSNEARQLFTKYGFIVRD